ncbi:Ankyrin repeat-containing domain protein [Rutstroemia sp. NJR-2017a BVV2]|nr:Ankyrin repeat-containing domain protein [Rutstroemia sp. NJR-2017a BVV2]
MLTHLHSIYLVGFPRGLSRGFPSLEDAEIDQRLLIDIIPDLVPEARVFEFILFGRGEKIVKSSTHHEEAQEEPKLPFPGPKNDSGPAIDSLPVESTLSLEPRNDASSTGADLPPVEKTDGSTPTVDNQIGHRYLTARGLEKEAFLLLDSIQKEPWLRESVFIATPHKAPDVEAWEDILSTMIHLTGTKIQGHKTRVLADLAVSVEKLASYFYCFASKYHITNFSEVEQYPWHTSQVFNTDNFTLEENDSAISPASRHERITEHHLRAHLAPLNLLNNVSWSGENTDSAILQNDLLDFLQRLAPSSWLIYQSGVLQAIEEATHLDIYRQHLTSWDLRKLPGQTSIQVIGPPGHGKRTLLKLLAQNLRRQSSKIIVLESFLDCVGRTNPSSYDLLLSLLQQILSQRPSLFSRVRTLYDEHCKRDTWTEETLTSCLYNILRLSRNWKVVIVVNNLLLWPTEVQLMFTRLGSYLSSLKSDYLILTSSKEAIQDLTPSPPRILDLRVAAHESQTKFIQARIDVLVQNNPTLLPFRDEILQSVGLVGLSFANADLYVKQLLWTFPLSTLEGIKFGLTKCPKTEDEIYGRSIEYLEEKWPEILAWCSLAVSWTLYAARPLRIQELAVAVAIRQDESDVSDMCDRISVYMDKDLERHLSVLLRTENQTVHLFNTSTRKYLIKKEVQVSQPQDEEKRQNPENRQDQTQPENQLQSQDNPQQLAEIQPQDERHEAFEVLGHAHLAKLCLHYLSKAISKRWDDCRAQVTWRHETQPDKYPELKFLSYAARYWPAHYREAHQHAGFEVDDLDMRVLDLLEDPDLRSKWFELFCLSTSSTRKEYDQATTLEIASELGLASIVCKLMVDNQNFESDLSVLNAPLDLAVRNDRTALIDLFLKVGAKGNTAILDAARNNNVDVISRLISNGVKFDRENHLSASPLHIAAQAGRLGAVKALPQEFQIMTITDSYGRTPLHAAAIGSNVDIVELLLGYDDCDINAKDNDDQTPLILATRLGHIEVVRTLCDKGANTMSADTRKQTALHFAAFGDSEIAQLLLQYTKDASTPDREGYTPLHLACQHGYLDVATVLVEILKSSTAVNAVDDQKRTPLHTAADHGHIQIVDLLLKYGADRSLKDDKNREAIVLAASSGYLAIVKALDSGDDLSTYQHLLHLSSKKGQVLIVRYLLEKGTSPNCLVDDETPLTVAASEGHTEVVRDLLKYGDPNLQDARDRTPLHRAASEGHMEIVRLLIQAGADVNSLDSSRSTPLHFAASKGIPEIMGELLKNGAHANARTLLRDTPLHLSVSFPEVVKLLLDAKPDIDPRNYNEATPLHLAIKEGCQATVDLLINHEADLEAVDEDGLTPFHYAIKAGTLSMLKKIWGYHPNIRNASYTKHPLLSFAADNGNLDALPFLLCKDLGMTGSRNPEGWGPLHYAAQHGFTQVVTKLLEGGVEVNEETDDGNTPLHIAIRKGDSEIVTKLLIAGADVEKQSQDGHTPLHIAAYAHPDIVDKLLEAGAKVNIQDKEGKTPLYHAAYGGYLWTVTKLVEKKADVQIPCVDGWSPLHAAADNGQVSEFLLQNSADVNAVDKRGWTPLMRAAYWKGVDAVKVLLKYQANLDLQTDDGKTALHVATNKENSTIVELLLKAHAPINKQDSGGDTALHYAARSGASSVAKILLDHGPDINVKNNDGATILHFGATSGHSDVFDIILSDLSKDVDFDTQDNNGRTPLHYAAKSGSKYAVENLLIKGANIDSRDDQGRTPLHLAIVDGETETMKLLLEKGAKIEARDGTGQCCLTLAAANRRREIVDELMETGEKYDKSIWSLKDKIDSFLAAFKDLDIAKTLARNEKSILNSRSPEGLTVLEAYMQDYNEQTALSFLQLGADPFLRSGGKSSAFEMAVISRETQSTKFFNACLAKVDDDLSAFVDGFKVLRMCLELNSKEGWEKLKPLKLKTRIKDWDQDLWTLDHFLYQTADGSFAAVPSPPEDKTLTPACLIVPDLGTRKESVEPFIAISNDLEITYKYKSDTGTKPVSIRADHPFPPRKMGRQYFEIEVMGPEHITEPTATQATVVIGLCGEFVDMSGSWPGWQTPSLGYHGDYGGVNENGSEKNYDYNPFAEGHTVGCGIDYEVGSYYFTLDGKIIGMCSDKSRGKVIVPVYVN